MSKKKPVDFSQYHPRERWFLNVILHLNDLEISNLEKFDKHIPDWEDELYPLDEILQKLESDNWCKVEKEKIIRSKIGAKVISSIEDSFEADRQKWKSKLNHTACDFFEIPEEHPLRAALNKLDRQFCFPKEYNSLSECDMPVPLTESMTESALHAVLMTILPIYPKKGERILLCGAKGGYLASLLASIIGSKGKVVVLDWDANIVKHCQGAVANFPSIRKRIEIIHEPDITLGLAAQVPWDAIIVNGSISKVPYQLIQQLNDVTGRILFFLNDGTSSQCWIINKNKSILREEKLSSFQYTPIPGTCGFDNIQNLQEQYELSQKAVEKTNIIPIQTVVPYPLSRAFLSANNAMDAHERHSRALKVSEALLKYISILTISASTEDKGNSPLIATTLRRLSGTPTNGTWLRAIMDLLILIKDQGIGILINEEWNRKWEQREITDAYNALCRETEEDHCDEKQVELGVFIQKLVKYRNKSGEGHGNVTSETQARFMADLLLNSFSILLSEMPLLRDYQLIAIYKTELQPKIAVARIYKLRGANCKAEHWKLPMEKAPDWTPKVALISGDKREIVLDLHPWLVWSDEGSNKSLELFVFNSSHDKRYEYLTYHNTDTYPDSNISESFEELFDRFPKKKKAEILSKQPKDILLSALSVLVIDGKIDSKKMLQLKSFVVKLELVKEELAESWIKKIITKEYPEVWFEE